MYMKIAHTVQNHKVILYLKETHTHTNPDRTSFHKYKDLKCATEEAVLMYSGIEFQIEVPEKNE